MHYFHHVEGDPLEVISLSSDGDTLYITTDLTWFQRFLSFQVAGRQYVLVDHSLIHSLIVNRFVIVIADYLPIVHPLTL